MKEEIYNENWELKYVNLILSADQSEETKKEAWEVLTNKKLCNYDALILIIYNSKEKKWVQFAWDYALLRYNDEQDLTNDWHPYQSYLGRELDDLFIEQFKVRKKLQLREKKILRALKKSTDFNAV